VESSSAKAEYPSGFFLAIAILAGMIAALLYAGYMYAWGYQAQHSRARAAWLEYATPLLAAMGLFVAGYLAYVETQHVTAVCGPVGDCNAVQNSPYATLFGVIPVGVIGLAGYLLILAAWFGGEPGDIFDGLVWHALLTVFDLPGAFCHQSSLRLVPDIGSHHHLVNAGELNPCHATFDYGRSGLMDVRTQIYEKTEARCAPA